MKLPWPGFAAAAVVVAAGAAGLFYAAAPQSSASTGSTSGGAVTIADAYVRAPLPGQKVAAAYFTVYNSTSSPDRITAFQTGAGLTATLHTSAGGTMKPVHLPVTVPANGKVALQAGGMHLMIGHIVGTLKSGQTVAIEVTFAQAGVVDAVAPVIAYGAPIPHNSSSSGSSGGMTMHMHMNMEGN